MPFLILIAVKSSCVKVVPGRFLLTFFLAGSVTCGVVFGGAAEVDVVVFGFVVTVLDGETVFGSGGRLSCSSFEGL